MRYRDYGLRLNQRCTKGMGTKAPNFVSPHVKHSAVVIEFHRGKKDEKKGNSKGSKDENETDRTQLILNQCVRHWIVLLLAFIDNRTATPVIISITVARLKFNKRRNPKGFSVSFCAFMELPIFPTNFVCRPQPEKFILGNSASTCKF